MKPSSIFTVMDMAKKAREIDEVFNPLFVSAPGVGKSDIIYQWSEKNGYKVLDIRAAYFENVDMVGYPTVGVKDGRQVTQHNPPEFWPYNEDEKVVVFLDEVNRGNQSVLNCFMQILTTRKIHTVTLPKNAIVVSCINPENGENEVNAMDTALKDRFEIYEIEYDKNDFIAYMEKKHWDPAVIAFVRSGAWKYVLPEEVAQDAKYTSPRTLSKLNTTRKAGISNEFGSIEMETYNTILGKNYGAAFWKFVKDEEPVYVNQLLDPKQKKAALKRLEKYSRPQELKAGTISVTVTDIIEKSVTLPEDSLSEMLADVCTTIPADQAFNLLKEVEFKLNKNDYLDKLIVDYPELQKHFREILSNRNKQ